MSYSFGMFFTDCQKENVLDKCLSIVKKIVDNPTDLIEQNEYYIPSRRYDLDKHTASRFNMAWLYDLFNFKFVYWEKYNLLGLCGYKFNDTAEKEFIKHVTFQNSCDRDYDYFDWPQLPCFSQIIANVNTMNIEQIITEYNKYHLISVTKDEVNSDISYHKRNLVYDKIYEMLDLNNWLWGNDGDFQKITINGIDTQETLIRLLKYIKKED